MNSPQVYIVILNYLQWQDARDCLESVLKSSYSNYSIILIDNNSRNNSLEQLADWVEKIKLISNGQKNYRLLTKNLFARLHNLSDLPFLTFIQNDVNTGFAAGNNIGLNVLAGTDAYVWLLNPDMTIQENTLTELVDFASSQSSDSIIGADIRSYTGNQGLLFYGGGRVDFLSGTIQLVKEPKDFFRLDYISGGCLFTRAANFKKFGLLPEEYFLYWEETDWCYRAKQQGAPLLVCQPAICYDKVSTVIGKGFLANYYYCRNGLLFISKFRKRNIPIVSVAVLLRLFKRIITGRWDRAKGVFKGTIDFFKKRFNEYK